MSEKKKKPRSKKRKSSKVTRLPDRQATPSKQDLDRKLSEVIKEMDRFVKLISKAEEEYMPSGPPMSPLTTSFFTCWAFFDACVGLAEETIGTTTMAVGSAFGMHDELVRVIGLMQESWMGVYVHHMKFGPARDYWTEFVFEAYVNHRSDVIFLKGLPDVPESRPHSSVNS